MLEIQIPPFLIANVPSPMQVIITPVSHCFSSVFHFIWWPLLKGCLAWSSCLTNALTYRQKLSKVVSAQLEGTVDVPALYAGKELELQAGGEPEMAMATHFNV